MGYVSVTISYISKESNKREYASFYIPKDTVSGIDRAALIELPDELDLKNYSGVNLEYLLNDIKVSK